MRELGAQLGDAGPVIGLIMRKAKGRVRRVGFLALGITHEQLDRRVPTASAINSTADDTAGTCIADFGVTDTLECVGMVPKSQAASGSVSVTGSGAGSGSTLRKTAGRKSVKGNRSAHGGSLADNIPK